ncbi:MAG: PKD-like domain-containing protein, partial [Bacteroidota bacterium]
MAGILKYGIGIRSFFLYGLMTAFVSSGNIRTVKAQVFPEIFLPEERTMECFNVPELESWANLAYATSECGGEVTVTHSYSNPVSNCNQTVTVKFTATDNCGNTSSAEKSILVNDIKPPVLTGIWPADQNNLNLCYSAIPAGPSTEDIRALFTDGCGGQVTVTKSGIPSGDHCGWTVTYTYEVSDPCGNKVTPSPTITYSGRDQTPPVIIVPPTFSACWRPGDPFFTVAAVGSVSVTDCDPAPIINYTLKNMDNGVVTGPYPITQTNTPLDTGLTIINWKVTDKCGNISEGITEVHIEYPIEIIMHPEDFLGCQQAVGVIANFFAYARGYRQPSVQWQVNSGSGWTNIPGANNYSYSFAHVNADIGKQFRAVFTNGCGSEISESALFGIGSGIALNPGGPHSLMPNYTQCEFEEVTLYQKATAPSSGKLFVYLQYRVPPNGDWQNFTQPEEVTAPNWDITYQFPVTLEMDGYEFRMVFDNFACLSLTTTANLIVKPKPKPVITVTPPSKVICSGSAPLISITSNLPATTYQWSASIISMPSGGTITGFSNCSNSCGSSISQPLTNSGTTSGIVRYTITPLHDGCQGDPVDIDITVHPSVLQPSVTTPVNYCLGSPSTPLIATPTAGGQIYWYTTPTGGTASTIVPVPPTSTAGTTTWYVSQTDGSTGCEGPRIPITVNVHPLPTATISGSTTVCQNAASPVVTFTGGVGQPPFTFTYQVNGGAETTIQTTSGNSVTLPVGTANPGTFTYTLIKVLDSRGCEQAQTGSISITVNPSTQRVNAPTPQIVCIGGSITFSVWATGLDIQYQWQKNTTGNNYVPVDGANSSSFTISNVTSADATNYRVVITGTCGTITTTPVALTVNPLPVCSITGNNSICVGQTTSFSAPSGMLSYLWSGPDGFTSNTQSTGNISIAGTYSVQITNTNGCVSTCERILTINPNPDITISPSPATICNGSSISLTANGANSYIWSPGTGLSATTGATVTANPTVTTTYTVIGTITATGCSNTAQVVVNVNPKPNILITPASSTICNGESTTLTASGGINYTWSPATGLSATSGGTVTASPTATTTYTVTGTDANGCTNTSTVTVTVNPIPTVAKPSDRTVCNGTSITSIIFSGTPSSGVIYSWLNNNTSIGLPETGTGNTPTFTAVNTGTEPVTATITVTPSYTFNGVTCIGTPQTFTITVDPTTRITTNLENLSLCLGTSQTLVIEATGLNLTYLWEENTSGNNWRIISGATTNQYTLPNVTAAMNGYRYRVTVTGKCGQAQSIATLTVKPLPICSITGNNNVCPSSTNTYSAPNQAGYTYNWTISGNATISGGTSGQTVSVLAGPTCGSYTLTLVTTLNGCSVTCSQTYNITDTTAPVWTTAAGILNRTLECTDLAGIANAQTLAPVATDLCNIITYEKTSGSFSPGACPQTGTYTNTWIARDACNNISSVYTQVITVVNTIPPVVPSAGSATIACPANAVAPTPPAVTDACGNPVPAVLTSTVDTPDPLVCGGTRIYTYTYTDCAGNKNTWSYTYTILEPVWQAPVAGSQTVACPTEATQPIPPTVADNCGRTINVTLNATPTIPTCSGTVVYHYTYTDCAGKTQPWTYTYTISDPVWNAPAAGSLTVNCPAGVVTPTPPTITDNCGRPVTVTLNATPTIPTCTGNVVYNYTYTDCAGKTQPWTYTYTISVPDWNAPAAGSLTVDCPAGVVTPTPPTISDNCGRPVTVTLNETPTIPACSGTVVYDFTYTDCAGKTYNWVYTYTIREPVVTLPAPGASTVDCLAEAVAPTPPVVTDNCNNTLTPSAPVASADPACGGTKTYTFTYTD